MKVKPFFVSNVEELRLDSSYRFKDKFEFNLKFIPLMFPNLKLLSLPMKSKQIKDLKDLPMLDQILLKEHIPYNTDTAVCVCPSLTLSTLPL